MLTPAEHALIRKDFLEIWSSKMARATLIAVPIGLVVVVPALFLAAVCLVPLEQAAGIQEMLSLLPSHLQHYNAQQGLFYLLTNTLFPLFFLMVPLMASAVSASCIFAGEKERSTIETLLLTPLRARQIVRAKLACCLSLSFVTTGVWGGVYGVCVQPDQQPYRVLPDRRLCCAALSSVVHRPVYRVVPRKCYGLIAGSSGCVAVRPFPLDLRPAHLPARKIFKRALGRLKKCAACFIGRNRL